MSVINSAGPIDPSIQISTVTPITPTTPVAGAGLSSASSGVSTSSDFGSIFLNRRTLENLGLPAVDQNVDNINLKEVSSALAALIDKLTALAAQAGIQGARNQLGGAVSAISAYQTSAAVVDLKNTILTAANDAFEGAIAILPQTSGGTATFSEGSLTADSTSEDVQSVLSATNTSLLAEQASLASLQTQLSTEQAKAQPDSSRVSSLQASIASSQTRITRLTGEASVLTTLLSSATARDEAETEYQAASDAAQEYYNKALQALATAAVKVSKLDEKATMPVASDDVTLEALEELVSSIKDAAQRRALEALLQQIVDTAASLSASGAERPGAGILSDKRADGTYSTITKGSLTALLALNPASMTLDDFLTAVNAGGSASSLSKSGSALDGLDDETKNQVVANIADFLYRLKAAVDAIASVTDLIAAANNQGSKTVKVTL